MNELFKNKPISETPEFFTVEQKAYADLRTEELTRHAETDFARQLEQKSMKLDMLREDAEIFGEESREKSVAEYEQYCQKKTEEIDANPKYSRFKKKKEKKKIVKEHDKHVNEIAVPEMISEARVQEAEENLQFFTEEEIRHNIETEKAKALFSPEERELFKNDRHINIMMFHDNFETDHVKNQKIVKGYLSENIEERKEFVLDIYNTVNTFPTDVFNFKDPVAFKEKYADMYKTAQKVMTYRTVLGGENFTGAQTMLKQSNPELAQAFEDKMEFFSKCTKQLGLYKNYLSSTHDYGATEALTREVKTREGDLSRFEYKNSLVEESARSEIRFGETKYEDRVVKRTAEREKFDLARTSYEKAIAALRDAPEEPEGEYASPALTELKMQADEAQKLFFKLGESYVFKYGHDQGLPAPVEITFTEKEQVLGPALKEFKNTEATYQKQIETFKTSSTRAGALLRDSYPQESLNPLFYDALMEEYGDQYNKVGLEDKNSISIYYKSFHEAEQKLRKLVNPQDAGEPRCPEELPAEYVMSTKEQELMKLTIGAYRVEGEENNLGEPLFRSFASFGNFDDMSESITKEELKQMLHNLGVGGNANDNADLEESQKIHEKNLAGVETYKKVLSKHYLDMFAKYGDVDKMTFEERLSRSTELSHAFNNMQVDNHWVDRFPQLFNKPEDELLVNAIHYYNLTSAFMAISQGNIDGMGLEAAKEMDTQSRTFFMATPDYIQSKKALFK